MKNSDDLHYMSEALELARRGAGRTSPNPMVGAVIVKEGSVVGRGWHHKAGTPHAEIHALAEAGARAENATIYVTLEPCCHQGRTGPCTEALIQAGIRRVVVAIADPNPLVAGCGVERLREAGILVEVGVRATEAARLNASFIKWISCKLPFVTLKTGMSLDGKIATRTGNSRWITGEESRLEVHRMRDATDVILTGIGTVLADDPELTTRLPGGGKSPLRVVLDRMARTPVTAKLVSDGKAPTLIVVSTAAPLNRVKSLEKQGVEILKVPTGTDERLDIGQVLRQLGQRGLTSVLAETGGTLNAALLFGHYADRVVMFIAPKIIGGMAAPGPYGGVGSDLLSEAMELEDLQVRVLGEDVMIDGLVKRREARDVYRACGRTGQGQFGFAGKSFHQTHD